MTSVALAHTHARSVLRKYIGVSITGALRGASEIPQRMVASGDSRPGRAALGSCESESWRSGDAENPAAVERCGIQDRPVVCDSNGVAVASGRAIRVSRVLSCR